MTGNVDVFIKSTAQNDERTKDALQTVAHYVARNLLVRSFRRKKVLLSQYILQTDVHPRDVGYGTCGKQV